MDDCDRFGQDRRLVGQGDAGVDVQHVGACLYLSDGVRSHPVVIAGGHLLGQQLASRWVDSLADNGERPVRPDEGGIDFGANDGIWHDDLRYYL